jgi:hypothetical protein
MESTWESRDLPVLDAVVRFFEKEYDGVLPSAQTFAGRLGMDPVQVAKAVGALSPTYLAISPSMGGPESLSIEGVTDEARRKVGQWPTPENLVDRLAQGLLDAADQEPDEQKKSRLRSIAEGLRGFARDVTVGVISNAATAPLK